MSSCIGPFSRNREKIIELSSEAMPVDAIHLFLTKTLCFTHRFWNGTLCYLPCSDSYEALKEFLDLRNTFRRKKGSFAKPLLIMVVFAAVAITFVHGKHASKPDPVPGHNVEVVGFDPHQVEIRPVIANGHGEQFTALVDRLKPITMVNGTYFDVDRKPLGDILINGKLVNRSCQKHAVAITKDGRVDFIRRGKNGFNWKGYNSGVAAGPRLIHNGKIDLDPVADGFSKRAITKEAWRTGIGKTKDGKVLFVVAKEYITLGEFAKMMLDLGSVEAMNLDGGAACGLYHKGRYYALPTLHMTNVLAVYPKTKN